MGHINIDTEKIILKPHGDSVSLRVVGRVAMYHGRVAGAVFLLSRCVTAVTQGQKAVTQLN